MQGKILYIIFTFLCGVLFSQNPDTVISCVGASKVKSAYLKVVFKQKKFFEKKTTTDTLEIYYVKDDSRKNKLIKFIALSNKNIIFYKIDTTIFLSNKGSLIENEESKKYPENYFIYELISFDRLQKELLSSELPNSVKLNCKKSGKYTRVNIEKRDKTNLDTVTALINYSFEINQDNNVTRYKSQINLFQEYQTQELIVLKSRYLYDYNSEIKNLILHESSVFSHTVIQHQNKNEVTLSNNSIKNNEHLHDFKLSPIKDTSKSIYLSNLVTGYTFLKFTYNSCAPCIISIPAVESMFSKWENKIKFFTINVLNSYDEIQRFNKKYKSRIETYYNGNLKKEISHIITDYPTFLIIDKDLNVIFIHEGYTKDLEKILDDEIKKIIQ